MIITHKQTIDLMNPGSMPAIHVVQDDRYSRNLELTLQSGGEDWVIPEGVDVLLRYCKSDGTGGEYNALPDGTAAWSAEGNVLTLALAPQMTTISGVVTLSASLLDGEKQLTTFTMAINVQPSVTSLSAASEDYVHVLTVGTVEALEPGAAPSAAITGTAEHPVLHLGIPCGDLPAVEKTITIEEKSDGYWDTKEIWTDVTGIYSKRTNQIPVKPGEGFLYSGYGADNVPSCIWHDAVGNILSYEQYSVEEGLRVLIAPTGAEYVRFYSHTYDIGTEAVVLELTYLPKGDDRTVTYESRDGGYWDTNGQWIESTGGSMCTNPILVTIADRIRYIGYGRWTSASVLWYDENGAIIASGMYCEEVHNRPTSVTLVPPEGAVYARFFSWDAGSLADVILGISIETESDQMERFKRSNVLYGKKYVACGDSFTAGDFTNAENRSEAWDVARQTYKTYPWWIADRNSMTLVNEAICGTTMYANGDENAFSVTRYTQIPADADYVTLCFGLNETDADLGTLSDTTNATVLGAWNVVLEYLITNLPYAKIGIIIPDSWCSEAMRDAIVSVAEYWGIPYLDMKGDPKVPLMIGGRFTAISEKAIALRNEAFQITDADSHPNLKAHEYRATVIENFIRSL